MVFSMSNAMALPDYTVITKALEATDSTFEASEAHGLLCGIICATAGKASRWEKLVLGERKNPEARALVRDLYENSYHQITDFSFEFGLLLPGDKEDINFRTEALGLWCQGFLTGLQQAKHPPEQHPSEEVQEGLTDLVEIAQVNFGDIEPNDDTETSYYELAEYVRLLVLMLFTELKDIPVLGEDETDNN
jgi:uncharacterized protein YgfB (UPF0149 family)